jgi:Rhodopirellula transposase DDE domain
MQELLKELLRDATAGDPMGGLRWTHKTTRKLAAALRRRGVRTSHVTVARLLRAQKYSLRSTRKRLGGKPDPYRDRQFRLLGRRRRRFQRRGWPVISVDTKKKELVGNFKNGGRAWRCEDRDVLDHYNAGYVVIGTTHQTAAFAVRAIRSWWLRVGRRRYSGASRLAIEADSGGANGNRCWAWKLGLQDMADEFGLTITVGHYPAGASKWNPIEHRMFNLISANWAGEPLTSYELMLKHIRTTRSSTGFQCRASLDTRFYPTKIKVSDEAKATVRLSRHIVLPNWNYTIRPRKQNGEVIS